jgi:hypothetical protein
VGIMSERARRTGLELQLLQAGVLPHEMEVELGAEKYAVRCALHTIISPRVCG